MTGETNVEPAPLVSAAREGAATIKATMAIVTLTCFIIWRGMLLTDRI